MTELAGGRFGSREGAFAEPTAVGAPEIDVTDPIALTLETFLTTYDIPVRFDQPSAVGSRPSSLRYAVPESGRPTIEGHP